MQYICFLSFLDPAQSLILDTSYWSRGGGNLSIKTHPLPNSTQELLVNLLLTPATPAPGP